MLALSMSVAMRLSVFLFNQTASPEIYTLSLHDALPICLVEDLRGNDLQDDGKAHPGRELGGVGGRRCDSFLRDGKVRKSTRLNSSHQIISYAVFCLKKKTQRPRRSSRPRVRSSRT